MIYFSKLILKKTFLMGFKITHTHRNKGLKKLIVFSLISLTTLPVFSQTNTISNSGNVGIGTLTPSAKLDVNGKMVVDSMATFKDSLRVNKKLIVDQNLKIKGQSVFLEKGKFKDELVVDGLTRLKGDLKLKSFTDTTLIEKRFLQVNKFGKVVIKGEVDFLNDINQQLCKTTLAGDVLSVWTQKPNPVYGILHTGAGGCATRIGIGTETPQAQLDVNGDGIFSNILAAGRASTTLYVGHAGYQGSTDLGTATSFVGFNAKRLGATNGVWLTKTNGTKNGGSAIYGDINGSLLFATIPTTGATNQSVTDAVVKNNTRLVIQQDGNVLLGDGDETNGGEPGVGLEWHTSDYGAGFGHKIYTSDPGGHTLLNFAVRNNSAAFEDVMSIASNGNVGIGTATITQNYKLSVEGFIRAREIEVNPIGWSDFVFKDNYPLKSLTEVETYIAKNKHLPDVPSEKEVLANGVNLGEMNAVLLQKVEELTLYMIAMDKRMQQLEHENQQLKK